MSDLLFAVPWWIPTLLAVIGVAVFFNGNRSQVIRVRNIGVALVLLAVLWALLSYLVDTDKEKVEKGTRQIIQAAVDGDWGKFQSFLTPSASLVFGDRVRTSGAALITAQAKAGCEGVGLKSATIHHVAIEQTGSLIAVRCDIISQQDKFVPTESSSWQFEWEQSGKEWKLREIRMLELKGVPLDQVPGFPGAK
jgi:hypothetical protein